jgi:signal peptidase I
LDAAVPAAAPARSQKKKPASSEPKDVLRELVETIVFVVVLVLLLKSFVAEAFVIPTGSMATTLWGHQKVVSCPQCGYEFPINCSEEVLHRPPNPTIGGTCPNCRFDIDFASENLKPACLSGDRVLVSKYFFDTGILKPDRFDVVVFKYPKEPQQNFEQMNYIKRLVGLPGETMGIWGGDLYRLGPDGSPSYDDSGLDVKDRWQSPAGTHRDDAVEMLRRAESPFEIVRKPPAQILAMRRIVFDNDHHPKDRKAPEFSRWAAEENSQWNPDGAHGFRAGGPATGKPSFLRFRNVLRMGPKPELITDFMGYNSRAHGNEWKDQRVKFPQQGRNWVGDLMVECNVAVEEPRGFFVLELSKGVDRFQARWNLANGICDLIRTTGGKSVLLASETTNVSAKGAYHLAFANVDERLTVWVGGSLPFKEGVTYKAPKTRGPTENDLQPASIGADGAAIAVKALKLWRDTYYTVSVDSPASDWQMQLSEESRNLAGIQSPEAEAARREIREIQETIHTPEGAYAMFSSPARWKWLRELPATTTYVQPDHYWCLGDNSSASLDGRTWGLVPKRLMLGRALAVYYPFNLGVYPFNPPENRLGPIR